MTDPELDLLRELLDEDPSAEVFLDVGRELCRREKWTDAVPVLQGGLEHNPTEKEGWELLARAAVACGQPVVALSALEHLSPTPERHPELARLEVLALSATGNVERAALLAESLVLLHPAMGPVEALLSSAGASRPVPEAEPELVASLDPVATIERAEAYVRANRPDRAIRVYRRLLFHNPRNRKLRERLSALMGKPHEFEIDDLSEELPDPSKFPPPEIEMPRSTLSAYGPDTSEEMARAEARQGDEEYTDPQGKAPGTPRKRRSLLRR